MSDKPLTIKGLRRACAERKGSLGPGATLDPADGNTCVLICHPPKGFLWASCSATHIRVEWTYGDEAGKQQSLHDAFRRLEQGVIAAP